MQEQYARAQACLDSEGLTPSKRALYLSCQASEEILILYEIHRQRSSRLRGAIDLSNEDRGPIRQGVPSIQMYYNHIFQEEVSPRRRPRR
ncbi:hypothetical protein EVAR_53696_1 [Eumeta japonica]|uniref:Uncharacterized protein n=1 Tax=Eumeta variegata TaxID=151549 RepID=A0A4C1ZEJ0_EUMVA|nr:hypothetical protein EVAR_53696_1 [Eumeta japonica]